ncbi:MAG: energy-coupling factor transporter ATPase [Oscillospiraceae bacterium]|nr:energy-coupling factor transporter ATPase [Oscillospiraceae bacterium]
MEEIIKAEDLTFWYSDIDEENGGTENRVTVFEDLDLKIEKGSFTAILGHNGCGKSTLAKHFNAVLLPCGGKVYSAGYDTSDAERLFDIRRHVGMVFQNPDNQIVASVVEEDVAFALENMGVPQEEMRQRVDEALKAVNMYEYREHAPSQLSGGQKQRVAIAGIIAMRPDCIVLDEPTAMLDPVGRREVIKTIRRLNREEGITIVLITHYMDEAAKGDRVVVMDKGKVILDDTPQNVFSHVEMLKSVGLDVPQSTQLMYLMEQSGMPCDLHVINETACADFLYGLLTKTKSEVSLDNKA